MKLLSLRIVNFRGFKDETIVFGKYNPLVGPNGAGKSTVLMALNILFKQRANVPTDIQHLSDEDFHNKNTAEPIIIEATFDELSQEAAEKLQHYVRQDKLVVKVTAEWDIARNIADVKHYGARLGIADFAEFFKKHKTNEKAGALKEIYAALKETHPELPAPGTKDGMRDALRKYEEDNSDKCTLLDSEDQFFGVQGVGILDDYIQWIYIPAVKDASGEQEEGKESAFGQLLSRTIKSKSNFSELEELEKQTKKTYEDILENQKAVLSVIATSLEDKLKTWAHPEARVDLKWNFDPQRSVRFDKPNAKADIGERDFLGDVRRMGHGLQRAFVVSVLQELATCNPDVSPTLILGFEEPELYQHPPQARYLANLLEDMNNTQVILTTHSPYFVSGKAVENIRLVRWDSAGAKSQTSSLTLDKLSKRIADALGDNPADPSPLMASIQQIMQPSLREMFFTNLAVFVEGVEDVAYISSYMELAKYDEKFRKRGGHFIVCGGKVTMSRPLAIACELSIPCYVVFDGDEDATGKDNVCLLRLCGLDNSDEILKDTYIGSNVTVWNKMISDAVKDEIGHDTWEATLNAMRAKYGFEGVNNKNEMLISATIEHLYNQGTKIKVLDDICKQIVS